MDAFSYYLICQQADDETLFNMVQTPFGEDACLQELERRVETSHFFPLVYTYGRPTDKGRLAQQLDTERTQLYTQYRSLNSNYMRTIATLTRPVIVRIIRGLYQVNFPGYTFNAYSQEELNREITQTVENTREAQRTLEEDYRRKDAELSRQIQLLRS